MTTEPGRPPYDAVLFDLDGTLVDTETLWCDAVKDVADGLGYRLTSADASEIVGRALPDTAAYLARIGNVPAALTAATLDAAYSARIAAGIAPMPGALELLAELAGEGIPTALVSSSPRALVDTICFDALRSAHFKVTIAAEDAPRTKPHPDPYQLAAQHLGVRPRRCVAVEDSPTGVSSAEAAGCLVLTVPALLEVPTARRRVPVSGLPEAAQLLREARQVPAPTPGTDQMSTPS